MVFLRQLLIAVLAVTALWTTSRCAEADPPTDHLSADLLVQKLGHRSYQTRDRARRELLSRGLSDEVRVALSAALKFESFEVRQNAREILQQFEFISFNEQLDRLTNPAVAASEIRMAGWQQFSTFADSGPWSRRCTAGSLDNTPVLSCTSIAKVNRLRYISSLTEPIRIACSAMTRSAGRCCCFAIRWKPIGDDPICPHGFWIP